MTVTHLFRYRCRDGTPSLIAGEAGSIPPPEKLPDWQCSDDRGIAVIYVLPGSGSHTEATIEIDCSPAIIKGWKIYDLATTRITDGGMINDRGATIAIGHMKPHERRRIDILLKGPPGEVQVTATSA